MRMGVLLTFYKNFNLLAICVTLFECFLLAGTGNPQFIFSLFWTKLVTSGLIALMFHLFKGNRLYFFFNLGYSAFQLYLSSFLLDFLLWGFLIAITWLIL